MENRFGLENLSECASCHVETFDGERYCEECSEERYAAAEMEEELSELPF